MGDTGPFAVGEKVLVPHTDKFYEAKVQKAQRREDGLWYYFLHYLGGHAAFVDTKQCAATGTVQSQSSAQPHTRSTYCAAC
jgi:mortality factor 4-like protein 1